MSTTEEYGKQCNALDIEIAVQHHVRELDRLDLTVAQETAHSLLTGLSMRNATVLERCRTTAAILAAVAKYDNGKPASKTADKDAVRIIEAIESAAFKAGAEYLDWHVFLLSQEGWCAKRWEIENLARMRDTLDAPQSASLYSSILAAFRAHRRVESAEVQS